MANRYGEAALMAVQMKLYGKALTPEERWEDAVRKLYPTAAAAQNLRGPRMAFLGLCEAGLVKGIPAGEYSGIGTPLSANQAESAARNKAMAVHAVELLRAGTHKSVTQLWSAVSDGEQAHSSQMDVVLALWKNGLIA